MSRLCQNDLRKTEVLKFPSQLLLGKDMFSLKFVDLENETSISNLELDMIKVLK
jgi:hypothetical protein